MILPRGESRSALPGAVVPLLFRSPVSMPAGLDRPAWQVGATHHTLSETPRSLSRGARLGFRSGSVPDHTLNQARSTRPTAGVRTTLHRLATLPAGRFLRRNGPGSLAGRSGRNYTPPKPDRSRAEVCLAYLQKNPSGRNQPEGKEVLLDHAINCLIRCLNAEKGRGSTAVAEIMSSSNL